MRKNGFTLVEILVAVAIVVILVTMLAIGAGGLKREADIRLTESTLARIMGTLQQYNDFWGAYPPSADPNMAGWPQSALDKAVGGTITNWATLVARGHDVTHTAGEALYIRLYRTPVCRKMLGGFSSGSEDEMKRKRARFNLVYHPDLVADATGRTPLAAKWATSDLNGLSLYWFVDVWNGVLQYEYRPGDQFPVVKSAGPDGLFGTKDDIKSGGM